MGLSHVGGGGQILESARFSDPNPYNDVALLLRTRMLAGARKLKENATQRDPSVASAG